MSGFEQTTAFLKSDRVRLRSLIEKAQKSGVFEEPLLQFLRDLMMESVKRDYPLGSKCRIYSELGTNASPSHIIIGHVQNTTGEILIQVHPMHPRSRNDTWSNVEQNKIEIVKE